VAAPNGVVDELITDKKRKKCAGYCIEWCSASDTIHSTSLLSSSLELARCPSSSPVPPPRPPAHPRPKLPERHTSRGSTALVAPRTSAPRFSNIHTSPKSLHQLDCCLRLRVSRRTWLVCAGPLLSRILVSLCNICGLRSVCAMIHRTFRKLPSTMRSTEW
jgi:hypothetical protein